MTQSTRRSFIKTVSLSAAGAALSARAWSRVPGANSDVRVGVVGLGNRGPQHLRGYDTVPGVRVVALCDADSARLERCARRRREMGKDAQTFVDVRDLLAKADIDAISIATPNHSHSLLAIWACQAGKDVYLEKPCSHNTFEGRQLVRAVKKYNRICQHGSQSRSNPGMLEAIHHLSDGTIGDVYMARALSYKWRP